MTTPTMSIIADQDQAQVNECARELHVYGPGSATSWSAGWRYLGKASKVSEALARWPEATFIALNPGTPFQTVVWTDNNLKGDSRMSQLHPLFEEILAQISPAQVQVNECARCGGAWDPSCKDLYLCDKCSSPQAQVDQCALEYTRLVRERKVYSACEAYSSESSYGLERWEAVKDEARSELASADYLEAL